MIERTKHTKKCIPVRAIAFKEEDLYVAQCLEYDIATQAKTLDELWISLERVLHGFNMSAIQHVQEPFYDVKRAPREFWEKYRTDSPSVVDSMMFLVWIRELPGEAI